MIKLINLLKEIKVLNPTLRHFELLSPPTSQNMGSIYRLKGSNTDESIGSIFISTSDKPNEIILVNPKDSKEFKETEKLLDERHIPHELGSIGNWTSIVVTIG
jgi:hypothetical protein